MQFRLPLFHLAARSFRLKASRGTAILLFICLSLGCAALAADSPRRFPLTLKSDDVVPTGNQWISLPTIRASDGALLNFNVLSMRDRGLLEVAGEEGQPVLKPFFMADGKPLAFANPSWDVVEYWVPSAHMSVDGLDATLTYCAPPESRAAFLRLTLTNRRDHAVPVALGVKASFGSLNRVTYVPVRMRGDRTMGPTPWVASGEVFSFVTQDTHFAWAFVHPGGSTARPNMPPLSVSPEVEAQRAENLEPGKSVEAYFVIAAGVEEFSASHNAKALVQLLDRNGSDAMINETAQWARQRTRTTGQADLDLLMNRNFLFTETYAWGRTIDTEQYVGITSRSPRYYVSAAYWDRDAMLWSFPGLLDVDPQAAREALEYALTVQLRNTGTHSRFIDGVVLEDGFQLDEGVAPLIALGSYIAKTGDDAFLRKHLEAVNMLRDRMLGRRDAATGLYSTLQDSQDEYQKLPFITYDNALTWKALTSLAEMYDRLKDTAQARSMRQNADALHAAVLKYCISSGAPGATGTIFASATDGRNYVYTDIPPGSLFKLPALGFVREDDPVFARTYDWLHSSNYRFSYSDKPYGLPGSYRLPFTTSWTVADHLVLARGRDQALKILRASGWDGGIISEGVDPTTGVMDLSGRAFATAAGYVAHAICAAYCTDQKR